MGQSHMDKTELGSTGIQVSRLGLGTVKFGRNEGVKYPQAFDLPDEKHLAGLLAQAKELGINLLDTAPAYGLSEERLGRLLKGQRQDWVIVGKAGEEFENGVSTFDFSPAHFEDSLARSLKRLQTDYLDVLLIHSNGKDKNILFDEKLIAKLQDFKKRGLVKAVGASTKTPEGGLMALELLDIVMTAYDPSEKPVLDYAAEHNKGVLLKKILASGHNTNIRMAMDYAFAHPATDAIIIGTITPEHLLQNVHAAQLSPVSSSAA
jgi:aryl-alcohol dehydrogenase-like predicted oxidoreductase